MLTKRLWKTNVSTLLVTMGLVAVGAATTFAFADTASAHGYIEGPASRALLCKQGENKSCGAVQYEPQSVEALGNFPEGGPKDGQITGGGIFPELYEQSANRWSKVTMNGGKNTISWHLTAPHSTKEWKYYITKKDWDPSKPLKRADLEQIAYFDDGGKKPQTKVSHEVNVPKDRSGYHLILGVWEIADTPNAFYQVLDVNLVNDGSEVQLPTVPGNVVSPSQTTTSIELKWNVSSASAGIKWYELYRNGKLLGTTTAPSYTDKGLTPTTAYTYTVIAVDGANNRSAASKPLSVSTKSPVVDKEAPSVPTNVKAPHQMETGIHLVWTASTDNVGVAKYEVYRDGKLVGTVAEPSFMDSGLTPATTYTYTVVAVDEAGNRSGASAPFVVSTKAAVVDKEAPTVPGNVNSTAQTESSITLSWSVSSDNVGVAKYEVYRNGQLVGSSTQPSFVDNGLTPDTKYTYTVVAVDAAANRSAASAAVEASTKAKTQFTTWDRSKVYLGRDRVTHNGLEYEAKWWTQGDEPGASDVWKVVSNVTLEWNKATAYDGQAKVTYQSKVYQAKWWTKGETPGASDVWVLVK
ncbi:lytic polysaccharide monooxygenase [Paenibacillus taiwanensis]|uniref:lytic polysaccharide monooxygenase n=1 Tax=Paenibacillus taiwanensis TaxID=401638 RepID=UPI000414C728|nr:lytic polysaccharide monooxygenase [Paenibacillus taiwanensis]